MAVVMHRVGGVLVPVLEPSAAPAAMALEPGVAYRVEELDFNRTFAAVERDISAVNYENNGKRGYGVWIS